MKLRFSSLPFVTVATVVLLGQVVSADDSQLVDVRLASGRHFTAAVDVQSDQQTLWLRFESGSARVWRPVAWSSVVEVCQGDSKLTQSETLALATRAAVRPARRQIPAQGTGSMADRADEVLGAAAPVQSVEIQPSLGNWDADAAADGLVLGLRLLDARGRTVAAGGTVEVKWHVARFRGDHTPAMRHARPVQVLGRWTRSFSPSQITDGIEWNLPFQASHPQNDERWAPMGLVTVKVTIPGQGTFFAQRDFVRTRPQSPTRDLQWQATGSPFFAGERIGR